MRTCSRRRQALFTFVDSGLKLKPKLKLGLDQACLWRHGRKISACDQTKKWLAKMTNSSGRATWLATVLAKIRLRFESLRNWEWWSVGRQRSKETVDVQFAVVRVCNGTTWLTIHFTYNVQEVRYNITDSWLPTRHCYFPPNFLSKLAQNLFIITQN